MSTDRDGRLMPWFAPRCRRGVRESRGHMRSAAIGVSALVHAAAIGGAVLMLKSAPHLAPRFDLNVIEISIVPEFRSDGPHANAKLAGIPAGGSADVLAEPFFSLAFPNVGMTPSLPDRARTSHLFDALTLPMSRPHTYAHAFDTPMPVLDCLAVRDSARSAQGRSHRVHPPCTFDEAFLRAPVMPVLTTYPSQSREIGADNDYRTFKPIQPVFDESLLPDEIPPANRAMESWIAALFR